MTDRATNEGRVWAERLVAFYGRRVPLDEAGRQRLHDAMAEAVAGAVRKDLPIGRWPGPVNAALDAWEAETGLAGPRVAHFDAARASIMTKD